MWYKYAIFYTFGLPKNWVGNSPPYTTSSSVPGKNKDEQKVVQEVLSLVSKDYIERRQGEPFKFLFLPKMGLLGSQASTKGQIISKANFDVFIWTKNERKYFSISALGL